MTPVGGEPTFAIHDESLFADASSTPHAQTPPARESDTGEPGEGPFGEGPGAEIAAGTSAAAWLTGEDVTRLRFDTLPGMAYHSTEVANRISSVTGTESGWLLFKDDTGYGTTPFVMGEGDQVRVADAFRYVRPGAEVVGSGHTHGVIVDANEAIVHDPARAFYDDNHYSVTDMGFYDEHARFFMLGQEDIRPPGKGREYMYPLGTPGGLNKYHLATAPAALEPEGRALADAYWSDLRGYAEQHGDPVAGSEIDFSSGYLTPPKDYLLHVGKRAAPAGLALGALPPLVRAVEDGSVSGEEALDIAGGGLLGAGTAGVAAAFDRVGAKAWELTAGLPLHRTAMELGQHLERSSLPIDVPDPNAFGAGIKNLGTDLAGAGTSGAALGTLFSGYTHGRELFEGEAGIVEAGAGVATDTFLGGVSGVVGSAVSAAALGAVEGTPGGPGGAALGAIVGGLAGLGFDAAVDVTGLGEDAERGLGEAVGETAEGLGRTVDTARDTAQAGADVAAATGGVVVEGLDDARGSATSHVADALADAGNTVQGTTENILDTAKATGDAVRSGAGHVADAAEAIEGKAKQVAGHVVDAAKNAGDAVHDVAADAVDGTKERLVGLGRDVAGALGEASWWPAGGEERVAEDRSGS